MAEAFCTTMDAAAVLAAMARTRTRARAPAPATRRMAACEQLTAELVERRRRAQAAPIVVAWKVERRANGQELISISSEDDDGGDDDESSLWGGSAKEEECSSEESEEEEAVAVARRRKRKRDARVVVDTGNSDCEDEQVAALPATAAAAAAPRDQVIYSVDSDDSDDDNCSTDGGACELVGASEPPGNARSPDGHAFEFSAAVDGDTTPETNDSSCGDGDVRLKSELAAVDAAAVKRVPAVKTKAESPPAAPVEKQAPTIPRKVIPFMRRKRLDEEDAAFLLFYGISETPTASVLGLIVGASGG